MNNDNEMPSVRINITLPKETLEVLKEICKEEERTRSNVIKRAIERYKTENSK